jgi:hypothetical protein
MRRLYKELSSREIHIQRLEARMRLMADQIESLVRLEHQQAEAVAALASDGGGGEPPGAGGGVRSRSPIPSSAGHRRASASATLGAMASGGASAVALTSSPGREPSGVAAFGASPPAMAVAAALAATRRHSLHMAHAQPPPPQPPTRHSQPSLPLRQPSLPRAGSAGAGSLPVHSPQHGTPRDRVTPREQQQHVHQALPQKQQHGALHHQQHSDGMSHRSQLPFDEIWE